MATRPRQGPAVLEERRRLSVEEAQFYARIYGSARKGSLAELRRRGASEAEAEDAFAAAFAKVMETVDPIARQFSAAQMVSFVKRTCGRCLIDERRRGGRRSELEQSALGARPDSGAESPGELAEEREAVAIGREALAMLPERDRLIFRQRHQMSLAPEEILRSTPGLSMRSYRKIIQRANTQVLDAFERIERGERCVEMERALLHRYVTAEGSAAERRAVEAHLAHCRACQLAHARLRGYLLDVASGLLLASTAAGAARLGRGAGVSARLVELASQGARSLGEASRAVRERLREAPFKVLGAPSGSGADVGAAQALSATSVRIASACTAGIAAGACVAAGVVPGIGAIGALGHRHVHSVPAATRARVVGAPAPGPREVASPSRVRAAVPRAKSSRSRRWGARRAPRESAAPAVSGNESPAPLEGSPSSARVSGRQTGTEFGAESAQPSAPSGSTSPPSRSPPGPSVSGGPAARGTGAARSKGGGGSGSEFGM